MPIVHGKRSVPGIISWETQVAAMLSSAFLDTRCGTGSPETDPDAHRSKFSFRKLNNRTRAACGVQRY